MNEKEKGKVSFTQKDIHRMIRDNLFTNILDFLYLHNL
jgi:hypothetical protein